MNIKKINGCILFEAIEHYYDKNTGANVTSSLKDAYDNYDLDLVISIMMKIHADIGLSISTNSVFDPINVKTVNIFNNINNIICDKEVKEYIKSKGYFFQIIKDITFNEFHKKYFISLDDFGNNAINTGIKDIVNRTMISSLYMIKNTIEDINFYTDDKDVICYNINRTITLVSESLEWSDVTRDEIMSIVQTVVTLKNLVIHDKLNKCFVKNIKEWIRFVLDIKQYNISRYVKLPIDFL